MFLLNKTRQLEVILREQIRSGVWRRGSRIPSEDRLMVQFGVSRPSMREALNTLVSEGIVERRHGAGTYVTRVPVGRIAVYARLVNIASPMGYWHRDMLMKISDHCKQADLRAEVLIVHGQDVDEVNESFERSLQFLPLSELEGAVCLTPSVRFNEMLNNLKVPHVSLSYMQPNQGPCVILDYMAMSKLIHRHMLDRGYPDYVVMHVDEPENTLEPDWSNYFKQCLSVAVGGDLSRLLPVPSLEDARGVFRHWWGKGVKKSGKKKLSIVFFDEALCDVCSKVIWQEQIHIPNDLAILTHANADKDFVLPVMPERVTFSPHETANGIWTLLEQVRSDDVDDASLNVFIKPKLSSGQSL